MAALDAIAHKLFVCPPNYNVSPGPSPWGGEGRKECYGVLTPFGGVNTPFFYFFRWVASQKGLLRDPPQRHR